MKERKPQVEQPVGEQAVDIERQTSIHNGMVKLAEVIFLQPIELMHSQESRLSEAFQAVGVSRVLQIRFGLTGNGFMTRRQTAEQLNTQAKERGGIGSYWNNTTVRSREFRDIKRLRQYSGKWVKLGEILSENNRIPLFWNRYLSHLLAVKRMYKYTTGEKYEALLTKIEKAEQKLEEQMDTPPDVPGEYPEYDTWDERLMFERDLLNNLGKVK